MTFPTLIIGMADPERDAQISQAMEKGRAEGRTLADTAERLRISTRQAVDARARHVSRHEYDLFIESVDGIRAKVCHIISAKDFTADMVVVWRTYRKTLESLSLPIWTLCGDGKRVSVTDLQRALLPKSRIDGAARKAAREALGMRTE